MFIAFVVFLSFFLFASFVIYFLNIFTTKQIRNTVFIKIKNGFIFFSLFLALILIIAFFGKLNFDLKMMINNVDILNISLLSNIFINSLIMTFFIIIIIFAPWRIFYIMQNFYNNNNLWKQYFKTFLLYGTLAILSCSLIYAFSNFNDIFFNNVFNQINININCDQNMILIYNNLKNIINIMFKSQWVGWIYIGYFLIITILCLVIIKIKNIRNFNFSKFNLIFRLSNNLWAFTIPMGFSSLICSITLNYQSFIFRNLILLLIISTFMLISYFIYLIFKQYKNDKVLKQFNIGVLLPIFYISYLAISNNDLYSENILNNFNFWITLYLGSFINGMFHFENNQNVILSKLNLSYFTPIVCSGVNTSSLLYTSLFLDWGLRLNNKICIC